MTNEEILALISKALTTSAGGLMNAQQLEEFILTGVNSSDFLSEIRVETNIAKTLDLDTLGVTPRMLRKGVEVTSPTAGDAITPAKRQLIPTEVIAYEAISYSWLRQALGGMPDFNPDAKSKAEEQIQRLLQQQYLADIVDLYFNGDTDSENDFLKCIDGILVRAAADSGVHKDSFTESSSLHEVMNAMLDELPEPYQQDPDKLRFYVSPKTRRKYRKQESARETIKGDAARYSKMPLYCEDVLVKPVFAIPDDKIILTLPLNNVVGWGTQMMVEREKNILKRQVDLVMASDVDANYVISDAVVVFTLT